MSVDSSLHLSSPNTATSELHTLPRRLASVLVGVGMLSAAACMEEDPPRAAEQHVHEAAQITAVDSLSERVAARMTLTDQLVSGYDTHTMQAELKGDKKEPNAEIKHLQSEIVDLKILQHTLGLPESSVQDEIANISNADIKQEALDIITNKSLDAIINKLSFDPTTAIAEFAELPADAQQKNQSFFQWSLAAAAARFASYDGVKAQTILPHIVDPESQQLVIQIIEMEEQVDAILDSVPSDFTMDEYYALKDDLRAQTDMLDEKLEEVKEATRGKQRDSTDIDIRIYEIKKEIERLTSAEIDAFNNFTAAEYTGNGLPAMANRVAAIDLSKVTTEKKVDYGDKGAEHAKEYAEFAQVSAENGAVVLHFDATAKIPKTAQLRIQEAFENARPILEAAFDSGDLSVVRFVLSDDYDPFYDTELSEIFMVLPKDASTTVDQLASGQVHEAIHALTNSATSMVEINDQEGAAINQACTALKDASFNSLELHLQVMPEPLNALLGVAKPEHKPVIQTILNSIQNGSFEKLIKDPLAEYSDDKYGIKWNNCEDFTPATLIFEASKLNGITFNDHELDYLFDSDEFSAFYDEWDFTLGYASLFKTINEANFVTTDYAYKEYIGHSQDNASEMMATLLNVVLSYKPQVIQTMQENMTPEKRVAIITALRASVDIVVARHPSLQNLLSATEADILAAVNNG